MRIQLQVALQSILHAETFSYDLPFPLWNGSQAHAREKLRAGLRTAVGERRYTDLREL
jgi:hypothetical protein